MAKCVVSSLNFYLKELYHAVRDNDFGRYNTIDGMMHGYLAALSDMGINVDIIEVFSDESHRISSVMLDRLVQ